MFSLNLVLYVLVWVDRPKPVVCKVWVGRPKPGVCFGLGRRPKPCVLWWFGSIDPNQVVVLPHAIHKLLIHVLCECADVGLNVYSYIEDTYIQFYKVHRAQAKKMDIGDWIPGFFHQELIQGGESLLDRVRRMIPEEMAIIPAPVTSNGAAPRGAVRDSSRRG